MRFHIGLSKSMKFSTLFKFVLAIISIFFLNSCVVHADSFVTLQNYSWCPITSDYYDNSSCNFYGGANSVGTSTINGITDVIKPYTSNIQSIHKTGAESHAEYFKWGGTSGCNTGSTISFNVDIVMNDVQSIFRPNVLDWNSWGSPVTRSTNMLRGMSYNGYYTWLGYNHNDIYNNTGVQVAKNDYLKNYQNCTFISYGSDKSVRFRCNIDSGPSGYFLRIAESNGGGDPIAIRDYATDTSLPAIVTGVKITMLNDPCKQYATDQSGVVNAITDQTNDIMEGLQDIIDNNNTNTQSITGSINNQTGQIVDNLDDIKDKQDTTNDLLQDIKDNQEVCTKIYVSDFTNEGLLDTNTGIVNNNSNYVTSSFIRLNRIKTISAVNYTMCFYNSEKVKISCTNLFSSVPDNTVYYRVSILKNQVNAYLESCGSGQEVDSSGINKYLKKVNQMNSPVTDLLTMPINFILGITDGVSDNSCTPYTVNFTVPGATQNQNKTWTFPCFDNIYNSNDSKTRNIVNLIDSIFTFVLIYGIAMGAIRFYEDLSSLQDTFDQQYKGGRH